MSAPGYILVLLSFAAGSAQPHAVMKKFETLELCQEAARAAVAAGFMAECLPQAKTSGSLSNPGQGTGQVGNKPSPKRSTPEKRASPQMGNGVLTPPLSD